MYSIGASAIPRTKQKHDAFERFRETSKRTADPVSEDHLCALRYACTPLLSRAYTAALLVASSVSRPETTRAIQTVRRVRK